MSHAVLSIPNLTIWYEKGHPVIQGLSLSLLAHEIVGLIGLNGSGKTTLINTISDIHSKYTGGLDFSDINFKKKRYTVFSEDTSFRYFTFDEYLRHVFSAYEKTMDEALVHALCEQFHLTTCRQTLLRDLSWGNQRKVFLITGFALRLPLLFLDEPVNGLDFQSTEALYAQIREYRPYGTILFSSHVLESMTQTADRVLLLEDGTIKEELQKAQIDATAIREAYHATTS